MLNCPNCYSTNVQRSRLRWTDLLRGLKLCSAYRCRGCGVRFFDFWWAGKGLRRGPVKTPESAELADTGPHSGVPERRAWERHVCDLEITGHPYIGGGEPLWSGKGRNLSRGGVRVEVARCFELGTALNLRIMNPKLMVARTTMVRVRNLNPLPVGAWALGCRFVKELCPEDLKALIQGA